MRILVSFLLLLAQGTIARGAPIDFTRDVQPILAQRCVRCHGVEKQRAGLRLDSATALLRGGDTGKVVVPGKSSASRLIHAIQGSDDAPRMPPQGEGLDAKTLAVLRAWIDEGARAPAGEVETAALRPVATHWALRTPVRPTPPGSDADAWSRTPIDRFILARLREQGVRPSPSADAVTLLRRLQLDLIGLPPAPAEIDAFLSEYGANPEAAYAAAVERLLASPHHGERWGRHWLDAARYADSNGYNFDAYRPIWKYRDWVIDALNRDLPYDRFVVEQLAGDLLPQATLSQHVATGFHRNSMFNDEGGTDPEQSRDEGLVDRVNTTGAVFLGLTLACCQCHDHKYDPFTQRDYYQLYAFFNDSDDAVVEFAGAEELARRDALRSQLAAAQRELEHFRTLQLWVHLFHDKGVPAADRKELKAYLAVPASQLQSSHREALEAYLTKHAPGYGRRKAAVASLRARVPNLVTTLTMRQRAQPRPTFVHVRGDFLRKGAAVRADAPAALPALHAPAARDAQATSAPATRLDLARWLVRPDHPLTARVMVNRVWQQYFGLGIVETENDFGVQGAPPSHPELLDWLAAEFIARGWSLKDLHRLIVTSAVYRQSSRARADLAQVDPRNRLLGRQNRLRLEAEVIRDAALASSGLLSRVVGGPSVFPPQPGGLDALARSRKNWRADTGPNRHRRGLYTHFWRSLPHPSLAVFDTGDRTITCTRRPRSTTPLQALTLANDQGFYEAAQALAARVLREAPPADSARVRHAFRLCLAREPAAEEAALLQAALARQQNRQEAWTLLARTLLNLDEFITRE